MKYSLMTTSMVFPMADKLHAGTAMDEVKKEYADMLAMVADCGIPAVEITSLELDVFGLDFVKSALTRAGLTCGCLIHMDTYAETAEPKHGAIEETAMQKILDAKALGADYVMLALMAQPDAEDHGTEELRDALIRNIRPIAAFGAENGVTVSVEDTPDIRLPLCDSADIRPILDAIPALSLTYDTGNMLLKGEDTLAFYRALKDRVVYVHLKDMEYAGQSDNADPTIDRRWIRTALHGQGVLDFGSILRELRAGGYDGWLMLEYAGSENHAANIRAAKEMMDKLING